MSVLSGTSRSEMSDFIKGEVEKEMEKCYHNILDEVDLKIDRALSKANVYSAGKKPEWGKPDEIDMRIEKAVAKVRVQPAEEKEEKMQDQSGAFRVLEGWRQLETSISMPWGQTGQSNDVKNAGTYSSLPQQQSASAADGKGEAMLLAEEDCVVRKPSSSQMQFMDTWLDNVEAGQIDIYTCLGLSNAFTNTPDTRKIWGKAISCACMQCVVPLIMVVAEFRHGLTFQPCVSDVGFRFIGAVLYTYSVCTMYSNANCVSRSELSNMMSEYKDVKVGFWLPLVAGEILNVFVAIILVITLYQIYTHQTEPADLILNAVAVNFLGSVDSEFVSEEMKKEAIVNFKQFAEDHFKCQSISGKDYDPDEESTVDHIIRIVLYGIAISGFFGSLVFMTVSTASDPASQLHLGMRHGGNLTGMSRI